MKTSSDRKTLSLYLALWLAKNLWCVVLHVWLWLSAFGNCQRASRKMLILSHYLEVVREKQERQESPSHPQKTAILRET